MTVLVLVVQYITPLTVGAAIAVPMVGVEVRVVAMLEAGLIVVVVIVAVVVCATCFGVGSPSAPPAVSPAYRCDPVGTARCRSCKTTLPRPSCSTPQQFRLIVHRQF